MTRAALLLAMIVCLAWETKSNDANAGLLPLGSNRFVQVHEYQGRILVHLREYYQNKEGTLVPGKRGIALTPEQWTELKKHMGQIDANVGHLLKTVPQQQQGPACPANQDLPF